MLAVSLRPAVRPLAVRGWLVGWLPGRRCSELSGGIRNVTLRNNTFRWGSEPEAYAKVDVMPGLHDVNCHDTTFVFANGSRVSLAEGCE